MIIHDILTNIHGIVLLLGLASVCTIVFLVARQALKASPFEGTAGLIMASCTSLLAVMAMMHFSGHETVTGGGLDETKSNASGLQVILIPYAALAISLVVILALWLANSLFQRGRYRAPKGNDNEPTERVTRNCPQMLDSTHRPYQAPHRNSNSS